MDEAREKLALGKLPGKGIQLTSLNNLNSQGPVEEQDLEKWANDEKEFEAELNSGMQFIKKSVV